MTKAYGDYKCGYSCVFALFSIMNLAFFLSGLGMTALGIYLWTLTERAGEFEIGFIVLGAIESVIAIVGWNSKYSPTKMKFYSWFLFLTFIIQVTATVLGIVLKDKIIDWATENMQDKDSAKKLKTLIQDNVDIAIYTTIAAVAVQVKPADKNKVFSHFNIYFF
jgi:hypothetical protein